MDILIQINAKFNKSYFGNNSLGWHDFPPESLKFHNFKIFSYPLGPKDYSKPKFSKIFDRLALPNRDWNLCTMAIKQNT